jgi:probable rRNA maturation factor
MAVFISADSRYPINRKKVKEMVAEILVKNKMDSESCEVSVAVVGRRKMKDLTRKYYGDNKRHEIFSFPFEDPNSKEPFAQSPDKILRLGDIILCWPEILEMASADDIMVDEEIGRLTIHGMEHLLGKHHEKEN